MNDLSRGLQDSNVEWIGEIPEHWKLSKLKYVVSTADEKTESFEEYLALENVEGWSGKYISTEGDIPEAESKRIRKGDLLFSRLRPYLAKAVISPFDGACSSEFLIFRDLRINRRYLLYILICRKFIDLVDSSTYGTKMPRANWEFIGSIPIPFPERGEQDAIVRYLDTRCSQIDRLIELLQNKIRKLGELRQSVIMESVTRGIDNGIKSKETGIEWIGEIPEHWKLSKLKYVVSTADEKTESFEEYLALENVEGWSGKYISTEGDIPEAESKRIRKGDLLFSRLRPYLAKAVISPFDGACSSEFLIFRDLRINRRYLLYILICRKFIDLVDSSTYGTKMPRANWEFIGSIPIPFPERGEQDAIVRYLDTRCSQIDRLIELDKQMMVALAELKNSVIYECITGKKEVS